MSDELERALRDMLAERAEDIPSLSGTMLTTLAAAPDAEPGPDAEVLDLGPRRADLLLAARRQWPLLLAAAAVAAILVVLLTTLAPGSSKIKHHPTATQPPAPITTVQRSTCRVADPSQWNADVRRASSNVRGIDLSQGTPVIEAVLPNGDLLVGYNRPDDPPGMLGTDLGLLAEGSDLPTFLGYFGFRSHSTMSYGLDVEVDNVTRTVVVSVYAGRINQPDAVTSIYALNVDTGRRVLLTSASRYSAGAHLSQGYIQDGSVYWEVDPSTKPVVSSVYTTGASGGMPRVVAHSQNLDLEHSAAGVLWHDGAIDRPADVPRAVLRHARQDTFDTFQSFVTDGTRYAWATPGGALDWYDPTSGRVVSFRGLLGEAGTTQSFVYAVAGPLVFFQTRSGTSQVVLDTRTGAMVPITSGGTMVGAADGTAVGSPLLDGPKHSTSGEIMRLNTPALALLRC